MIKLEQGEPVAYFNPQKGGFYWAKPTTICAPYTVNVVSMPLYSAPQQRTWVGLTDERLELIGYADLAINNIYIFNGYGEDVPEGGTPIYAGYKAAHCIKE